MVMRYKRAHSQLIGVLLELLNKMYIVLMKKFIKVIFKLCLNYINT